MKNRIYLLTIKGNGIEEEKCTYAARDVAFHYMVHDIAEQFKDGRIENMDGLTRDTMIYKNEDLEWKIEEIGYVSDIV